MRVINLTSRKKVSWGKQGEHGATTLQIYIEPYHRSWPDGRPQVAYKRKDGSVYIVPCTLYGNHVLVELTSTETAVAGDASVELMWIVMERNVRSETFEGLIERSIGEAGDTPPEPMAGYVERVAEIGAQVERNAERAEGTALHPPIIGDNGTWMLWDFEKSEYTDSGMKAQGPVGETGPQGIQGVQGIPGEKGEKGEPGIDGKDGESGADGQPGKDGYTPIKGIDYFDGEDGKSGVHVGNTEPDDDANVWIDPNGSAWKMPTATADTLGGVKIGEGLQMDGDVLRVVSVASLSNMRKVAEIILEEEVDNIEIPLDTKHKFIRALFSFPAVQTSAWYIYVDVRTGKDIYGNSVDYYGNKTGCSVNNVAFVDCIRIASLQKPLCALAFSASEGNETTALLNLSIPMTKYINLDESNGFTGVRINAYLNSLPIGTKIVLLGA